MGRIGVTGKAAVAALMTMVVLVVFGVLVLLHSQAAAVDAAFLVGVVGTAAGSAGVAVWWRQQERAEMAQVKRYARAIDVRLEELNLSVRQYVDERTRERYRLRQRPQVIAAAEPDDPATRREPAGA